MDRRTKLVLAHVVGRRSMKNVFALIQKLREATSPARRFQLTTDGLKLCVDAMDEMIGDRCDYAQLVRIYAVPREGEQRYSPAEVVEAVPVPVSDNPNPERICTLHVERQNLTMRMQIRRLTCLTNAFSKKFDNHKAAIALHFAYYNFCRIYKTLRVTPAMKTGVTEHVWSLAELLTRTQDPCKQLL
jgi:IS1 family transposase